LTSCGLFCRESVEGHYVPNAGFLEDIVFEDPAILQFCQTSESCEGATDASNGQRNGNDNNEVGEPVDVTDILSEHDRPSSSSTQIDVENDTAEEAIADIGDLRIENNVSSEESNDQHTLSTEDVDSLLDKCLLQALHTTVKDKDLPMPGSTLWYEGSMLLFTFYFLFLK
jgi:translation initiation factor 2D